MKGIDEERYPNWREWVYKVAEPRPAMRGPQAPPVRAPRPPPVAITDIVVGDEVYRFMKLEPSQARDMWSLKLTYGLFMDREVASNIGLQDYFTERFQKWIYPAGDPNVFCFKRTTYVPVWERRDY